MEFLLNLDKISKPAEKNVLDEPLFDCSFNKLI